MIPADNLHKLIKSMSGPEKRYFKLNASRQGNGDDKVYIQLFESIDKLVEYDEEILKKKLPETFKAKNLPFQKHYLFDMIMVSLKNFSQSESFVVQVLDLLRDEEIFQQRGLIDLQEKAILKAKELCYQYELFHILIWVIKTERLFYLQQVGKEPEVLIRRIFDEERKVIDTMHIDLNLVRLSNIIQVQYIVNPLFNDPEVFEKVHVIERELLDINFESLTTFQSKTAWYNAMKYLCRYRNELHKDLHYQKQQLELITEYPHMVVSSQQIVWFSSYLAACHRSGYYDEFEEILAKISSIKLESIKQKEILFSSVSLYKILYILNTGAFHEKNEIIEEVEKGFAAYKKLMTPSRVITINYNLAILNFICEDFSKSLDFCSRILNIKAGVRYDLQHGIWLLQILCHFELGNYLIIESLLRSAQRFLQNNNVFEEFDKILTSAIRKMINKPKTEHSEIYAELKTTLELLDKENPNYKFVIMEEVSNWVNSRIKKISLIDQNLQQIAFKAHMRKHVNQ